MEIVTWSTQKSSKLMKSPMSLGNYLRKIIKVLPNSILLAARKGPPQKRSVLHPINCEIIKALV